MEVEEWKILWRKEEWRKEESKIVWRNFKWRWRNPKLYGGILNGGGGIQNCMEEF
jgi:hypothetical protein